MLRGVGDIGCDGNDAGVNVVQHVGPVHPRDFVQLQGVQLGHPSPKVDCDGGVGAGSHQLRAADGHLQPAQHQLGLLRCIAFTFAFRGIAYFWYSKALCVVARSSGSAWCL